MNSLSLSMYLNHCRCRVCLWCLPTARRQSPGLQSLLLSLASRCKSTRRAAHRSVRLATAQVPCTLPRPLLGLQHVHCARVVCATMTSSLSLSTPVTKSVRETTEPRDKQTMPQRPALLPTNSTTAAWVHCAARRHHRSTVVDASDGDTDLAASYTVSVRALRQKTPHLRLPKGACVTRVAKQPSPGQRTK